MTLSPLTKRQRQVLELIAKGLTHDGIALRLGVSRATVKKHIVAICDKAAQSNDPVLKYLGEALAKQDGAETDDR